MNDFSINGALTVQTAEAWRVRLVARQAIVRDLAIDLQAVTEYDVFGLQLLWSARCSAAAHGGSLHLRQAGDVFAAACAAAGFAPAAFEIVSVSP